MKKKNIRAGIIGTGFAACFHYHAIQRVISANVEVLGAFSINSTELKNFTESRKIKSFHSIEEIIDESDVLHICTPPSTHEDIVIKALNKGKDVIVEKPLTGYFGNSSPNFSGDSFPKQVGLKHATKSILRMLEAEEKSKGFIMYAENWIYSPAIQKEKEIIEKTKAQILWIQGQQSHSGSHSDDYGKWHLSGGGSLMGKGCHPLSAAIYLKHVEGLTREGKPIKPMTISCRTHNFTRNNGYIDLGFLVNKYTDIEDYANIHIVFTDGTFADITACELIQGGIKNYLEIHANNHRTICNLAPNNSMQTFNPLAENFKDIYLVEKTITKEGWSNISPDESWFNGYQHEMEAFYRSIAFGEVIESNSSLASDVIVSIYSGYVSAEKRGAEVIIPIISQK